MLGGETRADLEEGLVVAVGQLIEDRAPGGVGQSLEEITHARMIGK